MHRSRSLRHQGCLFTGIFPVLFLYAAFPISASETPGDAHPAESQFWSFRPIGKPTPPDVKDLHWCQSPVDQFILARLEQEGITPSPPCDKRTLLRRVTFDLTGFPPSPNALSDFLADTSPRAFEKVVDRLLSSPGYGQRWGRHWLDIVRYADARDLIQLPAGSDFREIWRYRDWVVQSFNQDTPYRDFIRHQLAGDILQPDTPGTIDKNALIATGMLALADFVPGDVDKNLMVADYVDDMINVVSKGLMGITLSCARCHDHKYDPFTTADYYAMAGVFFSTSLVDNIPANPGNTPLIRADLVSPEQRQQINKRITADRRKLTELETKINTLATQLGGFEVVSVTWGPQGATLHRNGVHTGTNRAIDKVSSDPAIEWLTIGGPGSGTGARFRGQIAEIRVYDRQIDSQERADIESALLHRWFSKRLPHTPEDTSPIPELLWFRSDDPDLKTDANGQVVLWPDRTTNIQNAVPVPGNSSPELVWGKVNGHDHPLLAFSGQQILRASQYVPPVGSVFLVYGKPLPPAGAERVIGWEDAEGGVHGVGLQPGVDHSLLAVLRKQGVTGDVTSNRREPIPDTLSIRQGDTLTKQRMIRLTELEKLRKIESKIFLDKPKPEIPQAVVVREGGPEGTPFHGFNDATIFIRGNHKNLGQVIARRAPRILGDVSFSTSRSSGRKQLADWITAETHPLTFRVIVNRIWQHYMGAGIVRTVDNFGNRGSPPSHPKLLDFLARQFIENGGSIKSLHRLILLSSVYQQSSRFCEASFKKDPENILCWRVPRRRLEAEAIRDSMLYVSNAINLSMGGPSYTDLATSRRTLYLMSTRTGSQASAFGSLFGRADCGAVTGKRTTSIVAPQALFLLNDPFVIKQAQQLAQRVINERPESNLESRVHHLYTITLGRPAHAGELQSALAFLGQSSLPGKATFNWTRFCHILLCTNEFVYID